MASDQLKQAIAAAGGLAWVYAIQWTGGPDFVQPVDDHSERDPSKSAWHDVLSMLDEGRRAAWLAMIPTSGPDEERVHPPFAVDLMTGLFVVRDRSFFVGPNVPPKSGVFKPFFRYQPQIITSGPRAGSCEVGYKFGWTHDAVPEPVTIII